MSERVPLDLLLTHPRGYLIHWPRWDAGAAEAKIEELKGMGVEALVFEGPHIVETIPVLGKGNTSIVFKALRHDGAYAVKLRRSDADRVGFAEEARLLKAANDAGIGPKLVAWGSEALIMELIEGPYLSDWIRGLSPADAGVLRGVFRQLVDQARRLDEAGLDHGELVRLRRHTMMRGFEPVIIDFESASTGRRVANVTTVIQSLFLNTKASLVVERLMGLPERERLLGALRDYRREMSAGNYRALLIATGLEKDFTPAPTL
ncbi:TPA: serine/threonine protein kinase [Candidatus Bathyarchaeota archaeon]|nr:serine/threonine protein kinase [Candidatus Bathyarchaeota archaeon]